MAIGLRTDVLRPADSERADRVTYVELFFDLVFVFGLTQLGAYLYENQTLLGALEGAIMVCALWWAWVSTTWVTNWLDPVRIPVRIAVIVLAFIAFVMSASIVEAFGDRAWTFALAYIALKLGRAGFMVWATARHDAQVSREFGNVLAWALAGSALWIAGALLPLSAQLPFWAAALGLELVGSTLGYPVPGRGRMEIGRWDVSGAHIAERTALFVLIALGEGLLVTGFAFVAEDSSGVRIIALVTAFVAAAACWWIYFDHGERIGSEAIEAADTPGRVARTAYSWVHLLIVGGIVLLGVGDKEVLAHPHEQSAAAVVTVLGGPLLFLVGTVLFRRVLERRWMRAQLAGIGGIVVVVAATPWLDPLATGVLAALVLVATAVGESFERMRRRAPKGG
ncbi:low temperature requirement protein A [Agromyces binzhouensis]|uniref:Low temperature requirement protein A n=1 Tax=Agromyces binzhouensis TaxID=1817495 RepID=A0A4V1QSG7_9MICO|nr:low temperature requirement protein A [Agromyces binzhouensis]RXZ48333.1 low temperature requirement protein A [Agromyces binzhouensis]